MRKELESIKKIEDYLSGQLSASEKAGFEEQLANDPQLREEVNLQQELMRGVERAALTQQIKQAGRQFIRWRNFTRWAGGGLAIVLIASLVMYFVMRSDSQAYEGRQLPAYNEAGEKLWAEADKNIDAQIFTIHAGRDTVIETKGGIVLAVPANAFLEEDGKQSIGPLSLIVKEALDASTVMQGGLSTRSGSQLLETGGMFLIDARKGEQLLKINPNAGIYAEVPADTIKPGMQLYSGKRLPDGRIDWVKPVALERDLVPVDILSLDFYPIAYLDSLQAWGYNSRDKIFTDSLYYSLAALFQGDISTPEERGSNENVRYERSLPDSFYLPADEPVGRRFHWAECAINPAKIKAIWSNTFQNTLLATREFEERMYWIHRSFNGDILDLYVNNLDKPLWYIDSLVTLQTPPFLQQEFRAFAARKDGKIKNGSAAFQKLRDYYQAKTRLYTDAISKTQEAFWRKQAALDAEADQKQQEHQIDSDKRTATSFQEELVINLKEAARQLGYDSSKILQLPYDKVYKVQIVNTGWYNVDRAVLAATLHRTTLDFTDSATGKKAVIQYLPATFKVDKANEFERLYVYLLPDGLSSFMRIEGANGKYDEKLNELMKYTLVIIGYKGDHPYFYEQAAVKPQEYAGIQLTGIDEQELARKLNGMGKLTQGLALQKELAYFHFENIDRQRRTKLLAMQELTWKLIKLLQACEGTPVK